MKFKTIAEAFNYYRTHSREDIEKRAQEIKNLVESDPNADMAALNIELDGLSQAKANIEERSAFTTKMSAFNPVTGANFNNQQQPKEEPEADVFASKEYRSAFFKNLLGRELTTPEQNAFNKALAISRVESRADGFSTSTNTAAVLPTSTLNEVISKARKMGGLIAACRNFNLPTNISVPIGTPSTAAAWHVEGTPVETEKANIANISFAGNEIIKIFSVSAKVQAMSIPAFESYLQDELTNCVMAAIADSLVNGTGSGQGTGVLTGVTWDATNSLTYALDGVPAYEDYAKALATLKRGYGQGAAFAMNNASLYNLVYGLKDANGRPLFVNDPTAGGNGFILGKPVIIDDFIPDGVILLGNFQYLGYNMPSGIMLEVSRDSSFKSGLVDYRALAIADTKPLVDEAFVKLSEATA